MHIAAYLFCKICRDWELRLYRGLHQFITAEVETCVSVARNTKAQLQCPSFLAEGPHTFFTDSVKSKLCNVVSPQLTGNF